MSVPESERESIVRSMQEQAEEDEFLRLYGRWSPLTPGQVAAELAGFERPWWIIGGWAVEAATGYRREHDDTDVSILHTDVQAFVAHLSPRWHVWNNVSGALRPLTPADPGVQQPGSQLWLRRDADSPWVLDVPLTPADEGRWTHKFLSEPPASVEEVTWVGADGIRYLRPEIVLTYKARLERPKDDPDFEAVLPTLSPERRRWLREALTALAPTHHWLKTLP